MAAACTATLKCRLTCFAAWSDLWVRATSCIPPRAQTAWLPVPPLSEACLQHCIASRQQPAGPPLCPLSCICDLQRLKVLSTALGRGPHSGHAVLV